MNKKILIAGFIIFAVVFGSSVKVYSQEHSFQSLPAPKTSISGEVKKGKMVTRTSISDNTYINNNKKKKKYKTKIRILHSDSCPSFAAFISKPKARREKMYRKKRRS